MTDGLDVILLGFTVPDATIEAVAPRSAVLPLQTHRFAWNLVSALQAGQASLRVLSALPVPNFPEYPHVWIRTERFESRGVSGVAMGFTNILGAKHLTRAVQAGRWATRMARQRPADVVLVHGVHSPFLRQALTMQRRQGSVACAVLTDLPGLVRQADGWLARQLKAIDRHIVKWLLTRFDAIIALTPDLASELAPGVPAWITPGFAPTVGGVERTWVDDHDPGTRRIGYAGGLSTSYGVDNLVAAFRGMAGPDLRLELYGRGDLEGWIRAQCREDERIQYRGALAPIELYPRLRACSVLVNPRTLVDENLRFSFPSKVLEYVALGVPTVSTRLPGITPDLVDHLIVADGDSPEYLRAAIIRALAMDAADAAAFGARAIDHLGEVWTPAAQGPALTEFLGRQVAVRPAARSFGHHGSSLG